jgi:hypothetical protein
MLRGRPVGVVAANAIKIGLCVDARGWRFFDLHDCDPKSVPQGSQLFE